MLLVSYRLSPLLCVTDPDTQKGPEILGWCVPTITCHVTLYHTIRKQLLMITIICYSK